MHVGDELMFSNEGTSLLLFIGKSQICRHIISLEKLKEYSQFIVLPSHGKIIREKEMLLKDIENRLRYLKSIEAKSEKISYDEAVKECDMEFLHSEWHEIIYKL